MTREHLIPVTQVTVLDYVYNNHKGKFVQVYAIIREGERITFLCDDGPAFAVHISENIVRKPHLVGI